MRMFWLQVRVLLFFFFVVAGCVDGCVTGVLCCGVAMWLRKLVCGGGAATSCAWCVMPPLPWTATLPFLHVCMFVSLYLSLSLSFSACVLYMCLVHVCGTHTPACLPACLPACQGTRHAASHKVYWLPRIRKLTKWWRRLEESAAATIAALEALAAEAEASPPPASTSTTTPSTRPFDLMEYLLQDRQTQRDEWHQRRKHEAYAKLEPDCQPVRRVTPWLGTDKAPLPENLATPIARVRAARALFLRRVTGAAGAAVASAGVPGGSGVSAGAGAGVGAGTSAGSSGKRHGGGGGGGKNSRKGHGGGVRSVKRKQAPNRPKFNKKKKKKQRK